MNIESVRGLYFSPTGTTKAIIESIAKGIGARQIEMTDCTKRSSREKKLPDFHENELVILGAPVYYGRIPEEIVPFYASLKAEKTPVVLVVVYGNRAFDDALRELYDIAVKQEFVPIAGGAFIAEHSYSSAARPIAQGRPDERDLDCAVGFGRSIREKFSNAESADKMQAITVPGSFPYIEPKSLLMIRQYRNVASFAPETDEETCTRCGLCAEVCPTGAIRADDVMKTDKWQCIICFSCVKNCPEGARQMKEQHFDNAIQQLYNICRERREPEVYL